VKSRQRGARISAIEFVMSPFWKQKGYESIATLSLIGISTFPAKSILGPGSKRFPGGHEFCVLD
jgi:hypothetical protein